MEEMSYKRRDHCDRTKYLKPIEPVTFNGQDLLAGIFHAINPRHVSSINILHGERKGVVRMTCKTSESSVDFDTKVALHKVFVNGVRLAPVNETGHFIHCTLFDVPEYLQHSDIELILNTYGAVAHIKKEYFEYQGFQLENETRHVLFSYLVKEIPDMLVMDGFEVFANYIPQNKTRTMYGVDDLITQPGNIPKHVMETVQKTMANFEVRDKSRILSHSQQRINDYKTSSQDEGYDVKFQACKKMSVCSTGAAEVESPTEDRCNPKYVKTMSLADLPHGEEKNEFTAKYDKELETLSLISRSPSFSEKDGTPRAFTLFRRPSLDGELDERRNLSKEERFAHINKWKEQEPETKL